MMLGCGEVELNWGKEWARCVFGHFGRGVCIPYALDRKFTILPTGPCDTVSPALQVIIVQVARQAISYHCLMK